MQHRLHQGAATLPVRSRATWTLFNVLNYCTFSNHLRTCLHRQNPPKRQSPQFTEVGAHLEEEEEEEEAMNTSTCLGSELFLLSD